MSGVLATGVSVATGRQILLRNRRNPGHNRERCGAADRERRTTRSPNHSRVEFVALFIGDLSVPTWAGDRRYGGIFGDLFEMWVLAGEGTVKRLEAGDGC